MIECSQITVYTLPVCPNCEVLKRTLFENNIPFKTKDLEDEDVALELLMNSVTLVEAPIVEIDNVYMNMKDALRKIGIRE